MMKATVIAICTLAVSANPIGGKLGSFLKLESSDSLSFTAARDNELAAIEQDPCTKQYTGVAFDNGCCVMAQKHSMCLRCKGMGARPHYNSKWTDQQNLGVTVYEH